MGKCNNAAITVQYSACSENNKGPEANNDNKVSSCDIMNYYHLPFVVLSLIPWLCVCVASSRSILRIFKNQVANGDPLKNT